jgi:hypothetical protein
MEFNGHCKSLLRCVFVWSTSGRCGKNDAHIWTQLWDGYPKIAVLRGGQAEELSGGTHLEPAIEGMRLVGAGMNAIPLQTELAKPIAVPAGQCVLVRSEEPARHTPLCAVHAFACRFLSDISLGSRERKQAGARKPVCCLQQASIRSRDAMNLLVGP